ncbi:MAG: redoxin domain-containing protein [Clostridia bacterium]|nr:redoxin domain-containing protein [Clostridia bacterium]
MNFTLQTTNGPFRYPEDLENLWTVLFYYGKDFTPVAATELAALAALQEEFARHQGRILAIGPDSLSAHLAFLDSLARYRFEQRPTPPIAFPLATEEGLPFLPLPDRKYIWLLSPAGEMMAHFSYPADTGVNFTEVLRTLIALQQDRPTPHAWVPEAPTLLPPPATREEQITHINRIESAGNYCIDWYICFEGDPE